ncbi:MAG: DUF5668 domain-containing protein [Candidatus Falkowbacteria bacterium]
MPIKPVKKTVAKKPAVKKTPLVKEVKKTVAKKPAVKKTVIKKAAPLKSAMPEFMVPVAVKKTISNEVNRVLTPAPQEKINTIKSDTMSCEKDGDDCACCGHENKHSFSRAIIGLALIIFGLIYLGKNLGILPFFINLNLLNFWPLILILIGFFMVNKKAKLSILTGVVGAATFALIIFFIMLYADSNLKSDSEALSPTTLVPHIQKNIEAEKAASDNIESSSTIELSNIIANQVVSASPLHVEGNAPGAWFFEASFPIKIVDENLNELGQGQAKAIGDWATSSLVKFTADITYKKSSSTKAEIIFAKDNPSGLEKNYEKFTIPVELK